MSYIRAAWPLKYVKGFSADYVFATGIGDKETWYIEDYGSISDSGIVELLFSYWQTEDTLFKEHLLRRLADRLGVELRDRPLEWNEIDHGMNERCRISDEHEEAIKRVKESDLDENTKKFICECMSVDESVYTDIDNSYDKNQD